MKKIVLGLMLIGCSSLFAQQDPQFTQNMFNTPFVNPGAFGSNEAICLSAIGRMQYTGFAAGENPQTGVFSIHAPVSKIMGGLGLNLLSDQLGRQQVIGVKGGYAFRFSPNRFVSALNGTLGIGFSAGMYNFTQNPFVPGEYIDNLDPLVPSTAVASTKFDFDFGIFYKSDKLYFGASSTHLSQSTFDGANLGYKITRHYYITGGYTFEIPQVSGLEITPSVFIKNTGLSQMDINLIGTYNKTFFGGVTYRHGDAVAPIVGVYKGFGNSTLRAAYSYDVNVGRLTGNQGSHEISLQYCFSIKIVPPPSVHKTVRFL